MSTIASSSQVGAQIDNVGLDGRKNLADARGEKSTVQTQSSSRPIQTIKDDLKATEIAFQNAKEELVVAKRNTTPEAVSRTTLLSMMATLQDQTEDAKKAAELDKLMSGDGSDLGSFSSLNSLRLLSTNMIKNQLAGFDAKTRLPKYLASLDARLGALHNELTIALREQTPPPSPPSITPKL
jgi:hypothetical protein